MIVVYLLNAVVASYFLVKDDYDKATFWAVATVLARLNLHGLR